MLTGDFRSFRRDVVLPALASRHPQWQTLIDTTSRILDNPLDAKTSPETLIGRALPFGLWEIEQTELA